MAKKIYHIPLTKTRDFIKQNKTILNRAITNKKELEFYQLIGKSYYAIEIEEFLEFFKITKDIDLALKIFEYFNTLDFIKESEKLLNFEQFELDKNKIDLKSFFYTFCYHLKSIDKELFNLLFQKLFLHYNSTVGGNSNIHLNFKDMATAVAKIRALSINESFKEIDSKSSEYKLFLNKKLTVSVTAKSIKIARKKAYRELFFKIIDEDV